MEERKEESRTAFRTCIYSERLLGGARQGEREIKEGQRKTNMQKKKKKEEEEEGRKCANASESS